MWHQDVQDREELGLDIGNIFQHLMKDLISRYQEKLGLDIFEFEYPALYLLMI